MFRERPHWEKVGVATLVPPYLSRDCGLELEPCEGLVVGAILCRNGRRLPIEFSAVRANPLLRHRTLVSSCGCFCGALGIRNRVAASRSVSHCGLRCLLPRDVRRDSARQVPERLTATSSTRLNLACRSSRLA